MNAEEHWARVRKAIHVANARRRLAEIAATTPYTTREVFELRLFIKRATNKLNALERRMPLPERIPFCIFNMDVVRINPGEIRQ